MTGITAARTDAGVHVEWNPVDGAARYIVYYSRSSILENDGAYEDFQVTTGDAASIDLTLLPAGDTLFIAILAENADGEDSGVFDEEVSVELGGTAQPHLWEDASSSSEDPAGEQSSSQASSADVVSDASASSADGASSSMESSAASSAAVVPDAYAFRVLAVQSLSPTSIQVTFSHPIALDPQDAPYAFEVHDGRGTTLPLQKLTIDGGRVTIDTFPQTDGVIYELAIGGVVRGQRMDDEQQVLLPMDPSTSRVLFRGIGVMTASPELAALEVRNLRLRAIPEAEGQYTVEAQWVSPDRLDRVAGYVVSQSADGGRTALSSSPVPRGTNTVRIRGVTIQHFGLRVQVLTPDGKTTQGVFAPITLLGTTAPEVVIPPLTSSSSSSAHSTSSASSSTAPTSGGSLPQTGLPVILLFAGASTATTVLARKRLMAKRAKEI